MDKLRPFQEIGSAFLSKKRVALLADEMGLGKTVQAIAAMDKLGADKVLIVCPAVVKYNWMREIQRWSKKLKYIQVLEGMRAHIMPDVQALIVNYDLLLSESVLAQILMRKFAVGVFDESHYLKNRKAKRTRAVLLRGGVASRCLHKWFLTGTPVLNRPVELYPVLKACVPELIRPYISFSEFAKRYCDAWFDGFQLIVKGASNENELNRKLTEGGFMLRRRKKQVMKELPEKEYQIIPIDIENDKLRAKLMKWKPEDVNRVVLPSYNGADIALLRHEMALAKLPIVIKHIENLLDEKEKIVLFGYHKDVLQKLAGHFLKYGTVLVTGDTPAITRDEYVQRFQNDPNCRIFVGQFQAAGTGLTLTASDTAVFAEISWVPGEIFQAVDRIHRIGQDKSCLIQFFVVEESVEEYMMRTVIKKKEIVESVVEGKGDSIFT